MRWIVSSYLRQTAQQSLIKVVGEAIRGGVRPEDEEGAGGADEPPPPCSAVVVFGSDLEGGGFVDTLQPARALRGASFVEFDGRRKGRRIVAVETGQGAEAAERGTDDAVELLQPAWVVSAGFAGALDDKLRRGHLLLADTLVDETGEELSVGLRISPEQIAATPGLHTGRLLSVGKLVRDEAARRSLAERHRAVAYDQETSAVARVCRRRKVRFLSVRIVTDAVDQRPSRELERMFEPGTIAGKLGAATAALFQRPSVVKELWQMREDAVRYSDRLARFLGGVLDQLD